MNIEIISPDKTLFQGEAEVITLPGIDGMFQVMNNHAPMIAGLKKGEVVVKTNGKEETYSITGGLFEVLNNKVVILA
jgi:F-type H+-transporting ATPase subunit epsilon